MSHLTSFNWNREENVILAGLDDTKTLKERIAFRVESQDERGKNT